MNSFIYIDNIDVSNIAEKFEMYNDWDNSYTRSRRDAFEVHRDTSVIPLMWSMDSISSHPSQRAPTTEYWDRYFDQHFFNTLHDKIYSFKKGYPVRVLFTLLKANGQIPVHVDGGVSLTINSRIHIPIITNNDVLFTVNGETKNILSGEIYEINNQSYHGVRNNSSKDRIHLIVDWYEDTRLVNVKIKR